MPQFLIAYIGGDHPTDPEEGKQHFAKYMQWLNGLGEAVTSPANPLKGTTTLNPDGTTTAGGVTGMSGYTIVQTDSLDQAITMCKACPFLEINGSLEVSELVEMPMGN